MSFRARQLRSFLRSLRDATFIASMVDLIPPMSRRLRIAALCRQYLCLKHGDILPIVEDFILETERGDISIWERFIDFRSLTDDSLQPLELAFQRWMRP